MMKKVLVYSTPTCQWCTEVKNYLDSKDVLYKHYDVSLDRDKAMEMVKKSGQQGVKVRDNE